MVCVVLIPPVPILFLPAIVFQLPLLFSLPAVDGTFGVFHIVKGSVAVGIPAPEAQPLAIFDIGTFEGLLNEALITPPTLFPIACIGKFLPAVSISTINGLWGVYSVLSLSPVGRRPP